MTFALFVIDIGPNIVFNNAKYIIVVGEVDGKIGLVAPDITASTVSHKLIQIREKNLKY